jgi:hypothetical protein
MGERPRSSYLDCMCVLILLCVLIICVRILLYVSSPQTTICVERVRERDCQKPIATHSDCCGSLVLC